MDFILPLIEEYCRIHSENEPELLSELNRFTHERVLMPRMLSGHLQGRLLSTLSRMIRPKKILEIGTYTGYSALCLAEGLADGGKLVSLEVNEEAEALIKNFWSRSRHANQMELIIGKALDVLPTLGSDWDIIFIDADKAAYPEYLDWAVKLLNKGGWVMADNTLWSGKVIDPDAYPKDKDLKTMLAFNTLMKNHPQLQALLLPVRDGISIAQKIG